MIMNNIIEGNIKNLESNPMLETNYNIQQQWKFAENEIIKNYVIKDKQARIIWELSTPKKREDVFWRFSGINIFKPNCLFRVNDIPVDYLHTKCSEQKNFNVYVIGSNYIGEASLEKSIKRAQNGGICIIYIGKGVAYYQGEECGGHRPRYILSTAGQV